MAAISIVTPTFRRLPYLQIAIESARAQTMRDFELLVCDDGNSEDVRDYLAGLKDERIRYLPNAKPLGIASNNVKGFVAAAAPFVTTLHDDDRWTPDYLAACTAQLAVDPQVDVVFSDHWIIDGDGLRMPQETEEGSRYFGRSTLRPGLVAAPVDLLVKNTLPFVAATVFRRSLVDWKHLDLGVGGAYDFYLGAQVLKNARKVFYVPERLTEYRVHAGSGSALRKIANARERLYTHGLLLGDPALRAAHADLRRHYRVYANQLIKAYTLKGDVLAAARTLLQRLKVAQ